MYVLKYSILLYLIFIILTFILYISLILFPNIMKFYYNIYFFCFLNF
jgi:hypothetical protein